MYLARDILGVDLLFEISGFVIAPKIGSSHNDIAYISLIDSFCDNSECLRWNKDWLFSDADHLSNLGVESTSKVLVLH